MTLEEYAESLKKDWVGGDYRVTQTPGAAHASTRKFYKTHKGYDYATPVGTQVHSPAEGEVVYAGRDNTGWGNRIGVYNQGTNKTTYLSHLSDIGVKAGDKVFKDTMLGLTGGKPGAYGAGNTTGAHLDITEYLGRHIGKSAGTPTPARYSQKKYSSAKSNKNYVDILRQKISEKYSDRGRIVGISSDPRKLEKMGRRGKIIKVNV